MAETSGYFQAQWDDELQNPITGEYTGWWDRDYDSQSFREYFGQFISNGVFGSPTNQLKIIPGTGLSVIVSPGWAMINGAYYHNDSEKIIQIPANAQSGTRIDSIKLRYSEADRTILALGFTNDTSVIRGGSIYELKLAEVSVLPGAVSILAANIYDTRLDESVCGLVTGVLSVETTADLFAQYQAQFESWFDTVKGQVTGDLAIRLQLEFEELNGNVEDYQEAVSAAVEADDALIRDYVDNDYIRPVAVLTFTNKVCTISDSKVKATSLVDVYFTADTINEAADCEITVDTSAGAITLTAAKQPTNQIKAAIRVRV